jgi:hypothetical protein
MCRPIGIWLRTSNRTPRLIPFLAGKECGSWQPIKGVGEANTKNDSLFSATIVYCNTLFFGFITFVCLGLIRLTIPTTWSYTLSLHFHGNPVQPLHSRNSSHVLSRLLVRASDTFFVTGTIHELNVTIPTRSRRKWTFTSTCRLIGGEQNPG